MAWIPSFWAYAEPLVWLAGITAAIVVWLRVQRRRRRIQLSGNFGFLMILNFSAHPITSSEDDWAAQAEQLHVPLELDLDTPEELAASLFAGIKQLPVTVQERLRAGDPNVVVAFPAPRGSAALLDAILHGIVGEWTKTTWSTRGPNGGFVWVKPVDRQRLRLEARSKLRVL